MTEPRAALRLCVLEYLSLAVPWSTLARAFFKGLPTIASAEILSIACALAEGVGMGLTELEPNSPGVSLVDPSCGVLGVVEFASGSAECALLSCGLG